MATSMLTYYVKTDSETGYFQSVPQTNAAEGLTQIFILPESRDFLLKNWVHYYLDSDGVTKTDDHRMMDIGTDHLIHLNNNLQALAIQQGKDLIVAQADATKAKDDAANAKTANADLTAKLKTAESGLLEISDYVFSQATAATGSTAK